jgi:HYDIN/CFA65/VesB family protein/centrosomal CEP192-like protein
MSRRILRFAMMIGVGFSVLGSGWAAATTRAVTNFGDNGSAGQLRTLMNASVSGDTIVIPAGTITLAGPANEDANAGGDLDVLKNLIIQGAGPGATIIDGGLIDSVFDVLANHTLTLSGVTIRNGVNSNGAGGGGIRNFGTVNLANAIVSGNEAAKLAGGIRNDGGGIRNLSTMSLTNVIITGNLSRGDGGGIYNEQGSVMTLTDVTVSGNTVEIDGGGIYNLGTATLTRVTVSGNNADTAGGGIFTGGAVVTSATATLTNVTVSGNHINASGGGIYNSATAILTNVTVKANTANFEGGGIANFGSTSLKNVIVAGNSGVVVPGTANCSGTITSLGHNLDSGNGCKFTGPGDLHGVNPLLGPLQDNGGFTFTHALQSGSPAINHGTNVGCPATDQRGRLRDAVCDIGAYEFGAAGSPTATFSPTSLNWGTVLISATSGAKNVTLTNTGTGSLIISAVTASGNFSKTDTCSGQTLAPSGSCTISVSFTPSVTGMIPGALTVSDNAVNSPQIVALTGKGVGPVTLLPTSLILGTVAKGATSAPKTLTLTNNTSGSLGFTFLASLNYNAVGSGTKPCTGTLASKAKCTMSVTFTPTANGAANGSLAVSSASFPTQLAGLSGTGSGFGTSPLTFSPTALSFGSTMIGAASALKTVTVTNTSASAVNITNFVASGDFTVVGSGTPCGGVLGAGASCNVSVGFHPSVTGMLKGSVTFMDNATVNTQLYNLGGKAVLPVTFTPVSLTFAAQNVGTTSAQKTVKLTNNQAIALTLTSLVPSGQYTTAPGVTNPCGSTVSAHASCTFTVTFSPKQVGTIPGVVTVTHNASGNPQAIKLTGTGQ